MPVERAIELEIVPRLLLAHRVGPASPSLLGEFSRAFADPDVEEFVRFVRGASETAALRYVESLVDAGVTIESVYLDLLAPAARRLGDLWNEDSCDFVEVTVAMGRIQRILRGFSQLTLVEDPVAAPVGRVLLTCPSSEQHTLGLFMVAEFFVKAGWQVQVGAPLSQANLAEMLRDEHYDVLGFSAGCHTQLSHVGREIRAARRASRNPDLTVMVGGQVFADHPELVRSVGADAAARDAREAPAIAARLMELRKS